MNTDRDIALRPAERIMRLSRLGSLHQCRLSFMRQLTRRIAADNWRFERTRFEIDARGVGVAIYTAHTPDRAYSLVAFAHDIPDEKRSDRVIAEVWDATFALHDGIPDDNDIARLAANVPLQEAGRVSERELSLSRANRSVRLWDYMITELVSGRQPEAGEVDKVGYLMRTTAVYGSGKFGAADRDTIADRPEMQAPFQAEMLSVYLTRWFARDLLNHMARAKGGAKAIELSDAIAQSLGIGNSTGLGMAPYLINHPRLLHNWIVAREKAIAIVRGIKQASEAEIENFLSIYRRAQQSIDAWQSAHEFQTHKLADLRVDLSNFEEWLKTDGLQADAPWHGLMNWANQALTEEGQEFLASLILEPYGAQIDYLGAEMAADESYFAINGQMTLRELCALIKARYGWALAMDWQSPTNRARCWYVSEEKLEPRLGERFEEAITDYEQPLAPGYDAAHLYLAIQSADPKLTIGTFLSENPEYRRITRRLQVISTADYGEIHDNTIGADLMPIDMLRAKLSFFGATKFDPRSDRWVRITMFAGAPYPEKLSVKNADLWVYEQGTQ